MKVMGPVDMKKKYKAEWAVVTGAGTGIGKVRFYVGVRE
jgi:hypothetical protein